MKRTFLISFLLMATALFATPVLAQEGETAADKPLPKQEMQMFQIVLAKRGPNWKSQNTDGGMDARMQVIQSVRDAAQAGRLISAGLVSDETDVEFIFIFDVEFKGEVYDRVMNAPLVKSGFFKVEIYSYFGPQGLTFTK
ncbi:MAG: hypothetical protein ACI9UK_002179 [Candidatus Krumholzibacteriia bacterium]|jgi:hypothetical protein